MSRLYSATAHSLANTDADTYPDSDPDFDKYPVTDGSAHCAYRGMHKCGLRSNAYAQSNCPALYDTCPDSRSGDASGANGNAIAMASGSDGNAATNGNRNSSPKTNFRK